jgi:hypothetical protein
MSRKKTISKTAYENYLNELSPNYESEEWIIGGENRVTHFFNRYGTAIRKFDNIAFEVGFNDWKQNKLIR